VSHLIEKLYLFIYLFSTLVLNYISDVSDFENATLFSRSEVNNQIIFTVILGQTEYTQIERVNYEVTGQRRAENYITRRCVTPN
jgi:hypothetical protein